MSTTSIHNIQHQQWKNAGAIPVYQGEIWMALAPGEDATFPDKWVSRRPGGHLASAVNSKQELEDNAKINNVQLWWSDHNLEEIEQLKAERDAARAELDRLRKERECEADTKRLDWLEAFPFASQYFQYFGLTRFHGGIIRWKYTEETLRAAIDAAMSNPTANPEKQQ